MNWITKFLLSIGLKRTESWIKEHDTLPPDDSVAIAESLGSSTSRSGLALVCYALGDLLDHWLVKGDLNSDQLLVRLIAICGGLAIVFGRHAITKYNIDTVRDNLAKNLKQVVTIAVLLCAFATASFAQSAVTTPAGTAAAQTPVSSLPTPHPLLTVKSTTLGDLSFNALGAAMDYIQRNGEAGAGFGGTVRDLTHGNITTVAFEEIDPFDSGTNHTVQIKFGFAHTNAWGTDKLHDGLGFGASLALLHIPPLAWIKVPVKLADVRAGLRVTEDTDHLVVGHFAARNTVVAVTAGFNF